MAMLAGFRGLIFRFWCLRVGILAGFNRMGQLNNSGIGRGSRTIISKVHLAFTGPLPQLPLAETEVQNPMMGRVGL